MADNEKQLKEVSNQKKPWFKQFFAKNIREGTLKSSDAGLEDPLAFPEPPPPLPEELSQLESDKPLFVGKYDYFARADDGLGFKKGDLMYIINTDEVDWWYAKSKDLGQEGYVPSNYVAEYKSLDAEE